MIQRIHLLFIFIAFGLHAFATEQSHSATIRSAPSLNFLAASQPIFFSPLLAPVNPTAGVGKTQYISSNYFAIRSFDKTTGLADNILNIDAAGFFGEGALGDIYLLYDKFSERWFFSAETINPVLVAGGGFTLVVSNSDPITPVTQWFFYQFPISELNPNGFFTDYNQPATDQNAWYNGIGVFNNTGTFIGSTLTVVQKSSILAGGTPNVTFFPGLFPEVQGIVQEGYACPANNFDPDPEFGYFIWCIYDLPDSTTGNTIQLYRILNAGSTTPTLGPLVSVTIDQYPYPVFAYGLINTAVMAPHKGNLFVNAGIAANLQTGLGRLWTPHVRNKQLFICQDIQMDSSGNADPSGDRVGVRWYQFDLTGDSTGQGLGTETESTVPVLIQSGTLFDSSASDPLFYFNASIMTNKNMDMIITVTISGVNAYANAGYAIRKATDPLGTLRTPVLVTDTSFSFNYAPFVSLLPGPNVQRWGDESAAVTDPSNDLNFWLTQLFAGAQNGYGVQATMVPPLSS